VDRVTALGRVVRGAKFGILRGLIDETFDDVRREEVERFKVQQGGGMNVSGGVRGSGRTENDGEEERPKLRRGKVASREFIVAIGGLRGW
jgi:hypothetical protein